MAIHQLSNRGWSARESIDDVEFVEHVGRAEHRDELLRQRHANYWRQWFHDHDGRPDLYRADTVWRDDAGHLRARIRHATADIVLGSQRPGGSNGDQRRKLADGEYRHVRPARAASRERTCPGTPHVGDRGSIVRVQ
jgi:hypothetical protein